MSFCHLARSVGILWLITGGLAVAQDATKPVTDPPAPATEFIYPLAVTATADGLIYVADRNLPGIWKIENGQKSVFFQGSKKFRTPLNALLAGDSSTRDVFRFDDAGQPQPLTSGWIGIPMALAVAPDGTIYTADLELHRIWKMPAEGAKEPTEFAVINSPRGLTLDPDGNLWVLSTSSKQGQIQKVTPDGKIEPWIKDHPFNLPHNIVRMDDGTFFVTDNYEHAVWKIAADGKPEKFVSGEPLDRPVGLSRSGDNLLIADPHIRTIFSLAPDKMLTVVASSPVDPPATPKP